LGFTTGLFSLSHATTSFGSFLSFLTKYAASIVVDLETPAKLHYLLYLPMNEDSLVVLQALLDEVVGLVEVFGNVLGFVV
jgi:hypothetical protein